MSEREIMTRWPDSELESRMLADLRRIANANALLAHDVSCHVLSLLNRVRELERCNELLREAAAYNRFRAIGGD